METGAERLVMDPIESDATQGNAVRHMKVIPGYRWAKDGRSIIIPQGGKIRRLSVETGRVETIPFSARVYRQISESVRSQVRLTDDSVESRFIRWPASSPDGKRLVFEALGRLWIMDLPRGQPRPLTPSITSPSHAGRPFELAPSWSPDGRWIAYATWDDVVRTMAALVVVAPYSVRRREKAPVSTPLHWSEVKATLVPSDFNMGNFAQRLTRPDPWSDFFAHRQSLTEASRLLARCKRQRTSSG